jgi:hypothetical protein
MESGSSEISRYEWVLRNEFRNACFGFIRSTDPYEILRKLGRDSSSAELSWKPAGAWIGTLTHPY